MRHPADIRLDGVTRHYRTPAGLVRAVDGITAGVPAGGSLAISGPSGCGKSTLLSLIGGVDKPTAGRVHVGGVELSALPERGRDRVRREHFGFLFQSDNLLPYLTAAENVALQLALHPTDVRAERVEELLSELGLTGDMARLPDQLSGGQRLRVAVARALVHRPAVILADEPTGSVDSADAEVILGLLLTAQRLTGATLVVVTHDPDVARHLQQTLHLRDGRPADDPRQGSAA